MPHLVLELLLWIVFAFFVGCILGCVFRRLFGPEPELVVATAAARPPVAAKSSPAPVAARSAPTPVAARSAPTPVAARSAPAPVAARSPPAPAVVKSSSAPAAVRGTAEPPKPASQVAPQPPVASGKPQQPKGIAAPRGGKPDHLTRISGIGAKIERTLHGLGCFHFDQIASWTPDEVRWVDDHLKFKGRIARDDWQSQARALAGGKAEVAEAETGKKPRDRKAPVRKRPKK